MRSMRTLGAAGAVTVALLGATNPAMAAPGGGDVTYKDNFCSTFVLSGHTYVFCVDLKGVFNETTLPSGDFHVVSNGHSTYTQFGDGQQISSSSGNVHYNFLLRQGETHMKQFAEKSIVEAGGFTCTYYHRYHDANGQVQFDDTTEMCTS